MMPFNLKIVTPDGLAYDGQAEQLIVRTMTGDIGIMARHMNYLAPLGMGRAVVISDGKRHNAACIGGMVSVMNGEVTLVQALLENSKSDADIKLAQARIHRALVRKSVASGKLNGDMQK